ncbi:MAG: NAD(+) diphosphatase [Syntrophorhabdales bacterium]|jgi:NAD+ diphosphatase
MTEQSTRRQDGSGPVLGPAFWFVVSGFKLLVLAGPGGASVPFAEGLDPWGLRPGNLQYLGTLRGYPSYAAEVDEKTAVPAGCAFEGLRSLFGVLDEDLFKRAFAAVHLVEWDRTSRFCGRCGGPTELLKEERAKVCSKCGRLVFPRISPAVIVLVEQGDQVLLARSARFAQGFYSVLAGFVEPGEGLEEAVAREVEEETAIIVRDVRYFGSQPWPFPDSLMVGFTARYASGELRIDGKEIVDAGWFTVDSLPEFPGKISIARRLIDWFVERHSRP